MSKLGSVLVVLALAPAAATAAVQPTVIATEGAHPDVNRDGSLVVFESVSDLDPRDENGDGNPNNDGGGTYVTVPGSGQYTHVSKIQRIDENTVNVHSGADPALSNDGRFVMMYGTGEFIGDGGPSGLLIHDLAGGTTRRLDSRVSGDGGSGKPTLAISADGSAGGWELLFGAEGTRRSYFGRGGAPQLLADASLDPQLSGDGHFVAYTVQTTGPTFSQDPRHYAVFVKDTLTGAIEQISKHGDGSPASGFGPSISADGRFVAFRSTEALVPGADKWSPVYLYDRHADTTRHIATTADNRIPSTFTVEGNAGSMAGFGARISDDARYVAFRTRAPLTPDDADDRSWDLYVKDREAGTLDRVALNGAELLRTEFNISADGSALVYAAIPPGQQSAVAYLARLRPPGGSCKLLSDHRARKLTRLEREMVVDELSPSARAVTRARRALASDSRRNRRHRARNKRLLRQLSRIVRAYPPRATKSQDSEAEKLVDDARCALLEAANTSLKDSLERYGHGNKKDLADTLLTLRDVLKGDATEADKEKLLKENVDALFERVAGEDFKKKHTGKAFLAYKLVKENLKGNLKPEVRKQLREGVIALAKKASKKWFGDDAPELVDHLLILRDVVAGDVDDAKRNEVLKDAVAALGSKMLLDKVLSVPQLRAAMLGFELGQTFGPRIAADLDLIANKDLARDCATALSSQQSSPGAVDYSKPTVATVPDGLWHEGWTCTILVEGFVGGVKGGIVQAQKPGKAPLTSRLLWRITSSEQVVLYDPAYSG